jgi:small conductance mechanosensitive channel
MLLELGPDAVGALSGLYRLILLLQALVLILQNREAVRAALSAEEPENAGKGVRAAIASWNILAARWHFIAVPYFFIFFFLWTSDSQAGLQFLLSSTALTIGIIAAAYILNRMLQAGTERFFAVGERLQRLVPGIEARANRYTPIIGRALGGVIWTVATVFALDAWGIPTLEILFSDPGIIFISALVGVIFTATMATLVIEGVQAGAEYFLSGRRDSQGEIIEPTPQQRTLLPLGYSVIKWITIGVAAMIILDNLGVNIAPVLAGAGILGLAIGFGAQSLVKDIITGVFMLIEDNIAVGDIVRVKDIGGMVEGFTLRSVRLRDYDGNVHVIPNSSIDVVTNFTKEYSRAVFDIGVAYRESVDEVIEIIREVGDEMQADPEWGDQILEPVEIAGLDRFDDSAVTIRGRFKTQPIKQWGVRREFYRRIKNTFDERGIEIPFPYRTITWAEAKTPEGNRNISEENKKTSEENRKTQEENPAKTGFFRPPPSIPASDDSDGEP